MFVPIHDTNPLNVIRFQIVTVALLVSNIVLFLWVHYEASGQPAQVNTAIYGVIPLELLTSKPTVFPPTPLFEGLTLISYMFLHADWMHLIGNMAFLYVFADNVEDAMGHWRFLFFYLACGVAAGGAHALMSDSSAAPLIGASGAVAGVLGAYLVLYPRARVWVLIFLRIPVRIPAYWALGGWIVWQLFQVYLSDEQSNVAWWAHIGGFAAGLLLVFIMRTHHGVRQPT